MKRIVFVYKDAVSRAHDNDWRTQECIMSSLEECIKIYGLNEPDVEYKIISIEDVI